MTYSPLVNFIVKAARKSSEILLRDYFELENLQNSKRPTTQFVAQAKLKVQEGLFPELLRYPNSIIIKDGKGPESGRDVYFIVNPIDGELNLSRATPFFGIVIVACEYKSGILSPLVSLVDFPALGDVVYAENGRGAFLERSVDNSAMRALRMRVSATTTFEDSLIVGDAGEFKTHRSFGCDIYSSALVAAGKADIFLSNSISEASRFASIHIIHEAGGRVLTDKIVSGQTAKFIVDNRHFKF